ncbi:MAG TPA: hypothetical protein VFU16_08425 [Solirubrobacterales bacterium]|nr:hypothetical protein [Solirubrobacterales bacterium]
MQDDLARIAVGIPIAALWPLTVPYLAKSRLRVTLVAFLSALYVLAPQIPAAPAVLLLLAATGVSFALWPPDNEKTEPSETAWKDGLAASSPVLAALLLGFTAVALVDADQGWQALKGVVDSDRVTLASAGLVATVFIGGSVVAWVLRRFSLALEASEESSKLQSLDDAGRYIGWFERAVLFAFVIGGEPEAAAVALAAKSFARFPTLSEHHKGFTEYFLIGSLASLAIAVAAAAATRAALGIGPF